MTTEDFIITLFCLVDDRMGNVEKRSDALLYPSELVTMLSDKPPPWQISVFETRIAFILRHTLRDILLSIVRETS